MRIAAFALLFPACAASAPEMLDVPTWLTRTAIPLADEARAFREFEDCLEGVRVVALGEATHGQHESFERERALTMHLVRHAHVRLVAYEASSSSALAADAYVSGASDDLAAAMSGLGMLVWQVEENAAFLADLRAWIPDADPGDRVRFVGIDVQDPAATAGRIGTLLGGDGALEKRLADWGARIEPAIQKLWTGDASGYHALAAEVVALDAEVRAAAEARGRPVPEIDKRLGELRGALEMHDSPGGRDRAMAQMLLDELATLPANLRAVVWAHNGHVTRGPLRYLEIDETGVGGHVAASIGDAYYALGFAFGEGEFQANAKGADDRFGFRTYSLSPAPEGSLESVQRQACDGDFLLDLRGAPRLGPVADWLAAGHGQRWFGGYGMPDDCDAATRDAASLIATVPRVDYDGTLFLARTTAAWPRDRSRILRAPTSSGS